MRFAASNNPGAVTSRELIVLSYKQRHVAVPLPATYEDAVKEARTRFNIPNANITFSTRDLSSCHDLPVEIVQDTWEDLGPIVSRITVTCEEGVKGGSQDADDGPLPMILEDGGPTGLSYVQGNTSHAASDDPAPASALRRRQSVGPSTHRSRRSRARSQSLAPSPAKSTAGDPPRGATESRKRQNNKSVPGPVPSQQRVPSSSAQISRQQPSPKLEPGSSPVPPEVDEGEDIEMHEEERIVVEDNLYEEEEEEDEDEAPPPSPKKAAKRQRIESDDEDEEDRRLSQRAKLSKSQAARSSNTASGKTTAPVTPKKATSAMAQGSSSSLNKSAVASAKTPKASAAGEELITFDIALQLYDEEEDEDRLDEEVMAFKTKAKHTIRKVLSTALKQFSDLEGVPLEKIGLYFTKDGKEIRCGLDQTIAELGIGDGDQLIMTAYDDEDLGDAGALSEDGD